MVSLTGDLEATKTSTETHLRCGEYSQESGSEAASEGEMGGLQSWDISKKLVPLGRSCPWRPCEHSDVTEDSEGCRHLLPTEAGSGVLSLEEVCLAIKYRTENSCPEEESANLGN